MGTLTHYIVKTTETAGGQDAYLVQRKDGGWDTTFARSSAHEFATKAEARTTRAEQIGNGVILRVNEDGTEEDPVYGCILGACHVHEGQGCQLGHEPATRCPWQHGEAPEPEANENRKEGLSMFCVFTPFKGMTGAILDLAGPWPKSLLADPPENTPVRLRNPPWTGCAVWEGAAEREPGEPAGRWSVTGSWRKPNYVEMRRLADGHFPLRREALPESSKLVPFGTKEGAC